VNASAAHRRQTSAICVSRQAKFDEPSAHAPQTHAPHQARKRRCHQIDSPLPKKTLKDLRLARVRWGSSLSGPAKIKTVRHANLLAVAWSGALSRGLVRRLCANKNLNANLPDRHVHIRSNGQIRCARRALPGNPLSRFATRRAVAMLRNTRIRGQPPTIALRLKY